MSSEISSEIVEIKQNAPVYGEGRGFRIDVKSNEVLDSVKKLVLIKANNKILHS